MASETTTSWTSDELTAIGRAEELQVTHPTPLLPEKNHTEDCHA